MDSRRPPFDPKVSNHLELVEGYFKIERESSILRTMNGLAKENRGQSFDSHDESWINERESWKRDQRWKRSGDVSSSRRRHKSRRAGNRAEAGIALQNPRCHGFHDILFTFLVKNRLPYLDRACVGHMAETGHNEFYPAHGPPSCLPSS